MAQFFQWSYLFKILSQKIDFFQGKKFFYMFPFKSYIQINIL